MELTAETFGDESRAKSLADGVDGGGGARGAAARDEDVVGKGLGELFGLASSGAFVEERHDFLERLSAVHEGFAVEKDRGHGHHAAGLGLLLRERAVDRDDGDVRVFDRHQIERLHDVGTVVAGKRNEDLKAERSR